MMKKAFINPSIDIREVKIESVLTASQPTPATNEDTIKAMMPDNVTSITNLDINID